MNKKQKTGKCALCGAPDSRHRQVDAQMGCVIAGDDIESVARDYGYETVVDLIKFWSECYEFSVDGWTEAMRRNERTY